MFQFLAHIGQPEEPLGRAGECSPWDRPLVGRASEARRVTSNADGPLPLAAPAVEESVSPVLRTRCSNQFQLVRARIAGCNDAVMRIDPGSGRELGELLVGGNVGRVWRVGHTVRREQGPWSPAVHRLLVHLEGMSEVPRFHGVDELGREVLDSCPAASSTWIARC